MLTLAQSTLKKGKFAHRNGRTEIEEPAPATRRGGSRTSRGNMIPKTSPSAPIPQNNPRQGSKTPPHGKTAPLYSSSNARLGPPNSSARPDPMNGAIMNSAEARGTDAGGAKSQMID